MKFTVLTTLLLYSYLGWSQSEVFKMSCISNLDFIVAIGTDNGTSIHSINNITSDTSWLEYIVNPLDKVYGGICQDSIFSIVLSTSGSVDFISFRIHSDGGISGVRDECIAFQGFDRGFKCEFYFIAFEDASTLICRLEGGLKYRVQFHPLGYPVYTQIP